MISQIKNTLKTNSDFFTSGVIAASGCIALAASPAIVVALATLPLLPRACSACLSRNRLRRELSRSNSLSTQNANQISLNHLNHSNERQKEEPLSFPNDGENKAGQESKSHAVCNTTSNCSPVLLDISRIIASPLSIDNNSLAKIRKQNFFKRIDDAKWNKIIEDMKLLLPIQEHEISSLKYNQFHLLQKESKERWSLLAVFCSMKEILTLEQTSRILLYKICLEDPRFQDKVAVIRLLDEQGKIDPVAKELFEQLLPPRNSEASSPYHFTQTQIAHFYQSLKTSDDSTFFVVSLREDDPASRVNLLENEMEKTIGSIFRNKSKIAIFPPSMIKQIYKSKFGENTPHAAAHLGYAPVEMLSNWEMRPLSIAFEPYYPLETIHEYPTTDCPPVTQYIHDAYFHLPIEAANIHRKVWALFGKELPLSSFPKTKLFLLDREFRIYLVQKYTDIDKFFIMIEKVIKFCILEKEDPKQLVEIFAKCTISNIEIFKSTFPSILYDDYLCFKEKQEANHIDLSTEETHILRDRVREIVCLLESLYWIYRT